MLILVVVYNEDVSWADVTKPRAVEKFKCHKVLQPSVACLRLFPGITLSTVKAFLSPPIAGVVLESYGSGTAPSNRPDLLDVIKEACDRGVLIVNCSQCKKGLVSDIYETSKGLYTRGVIPGADLTPECALAKLSYLLGKYDDISKCRRLMAKSIRGELTQVQKQRFSYVQSTPTTDRADLLSVLTSMFDKKSDFQGTADFDPNIDTTQDVEVVEAVEKAIIPILLCQASRSGNLDNLKSILSLDPDLINRQDYDGRAPLHIAASGGNESCVKYLLQNGALLHIQDIFGHTPLFDAARFKHQGTAKLLVQAGGHFAPSEKQSVNELMCNAVRENDVETVLVLLESGVELNSTQNQPTALHLACSIGREEIIDLILARGECNLNWKDEEGNTPVDLAIKRGHLNIAQKLIKK